jgi:large subunit ribosomal protein L23
VKDPYSIISQPHITEKSVALSYGDDRVKDESQLVRKYTFIVATDSNKIEIKAALEAIYNQGKRQEQAINVTSVRTVKVLGKFRRRTQKSSGYEPNRKKAIITLAKGQILEDYGV